GVEGLKGPGDVLRGQSRADVGVFGDVIVIVVIGKIIVKHWPVSGQCDYAEEQTGKNCPARVFCTVHQGWLVLPKRAWSSIRIKIQNERGQAGDVIKSGCNTSPR